MTATVLVGSRPIVASASGRGIVESLEGPAITSSLGRNQGLRNSCTISYHSPALIACPESMFSNIRTVSATYPKR